MKLIKAILIAIVIWVLGISVYTLSFFFPVLEDGEFQANMVLALCIIPIVSLGAHLYYKWNGQLNGWAAGTLMFLIAALLDALITVPYFILPYGGSYQSFFGAVSFWLIALEFISVVFLYWKLRIVQAS